MSTRTLTGRGGDPAIRVRGDHLRGHVDTLVLGVLDGERPMNMEAIRTALRIRTGGRVDLSDGTLKPALLRLEGEGLIRADRSDHRRPHYSPNPSGRRSLHSSIRAWEEQCQAFAAVYDAALPAPALTAKVVALRIAPASVDPAG